MTSELSVDHIAITVKDMDRAVDFYRDVLGFEVLGQLMLDEDTFKLVFLQAGSARIELFAFTEDGRHTGSDRNEDLGFKHLAFQTDDVDGLVMRLKEHGVQVTVEPTDAAGGVRLAFFLDPDGNLLEFIDRLPDMAPYQPGWGNS